MFIFDSCPTAYWILGYLLSGIIILLSTYQKVPTRIVLSLSLLLLVFMRIPVVVYNQELNADESQMLSHALTLYQDPVYWRSVDGTTIGPLDNYLLVIPKLIGYPIDYTSGRLMGLLCCAGALLFIFFSLRNWLGSAVARNAILVPIIFLAFTQEADFIHYSSEQLPVLLLSCCVWILSVISVAKTVSSRWTFFLGLIAGLTPFAKLQAVPQALIIVFAAAWFSFLFYRKTSNIRPLIGLILGGLVFPLTVLVWALSHSVFQDLIDFYLLGNVIYAGESKWVSIPAQFVAIVGLSPDFTLYSLVLILPFLWGLRRLFFAVSNQVGLRDSLPYIFLMLILTGIYSATKSGNSFTHYLNFCIYPWIMFASWGLSRYPASFSVVSIVLLFWFLITDVIAYRTSHQLNAFVSSDGANKLQKSPIVNKLEAYAQPRDQMVVWGWQCKYYVEAQLAQGTAENHSERSIFKHPMIDKYRQRFLSDMKRNKPAIFIDAVGKNSLWVQNRATQGYESFPELASLINQQYQLVSDEDGNRLFVRKDRLTP